MEGSRFPAGATDVSRDIDDALAAAHIGASEAPGRGACVYDVFGADAVSRKLCRKKAAVKRLQFQPFGATFGASEAPVRGACFYDGFEADFASRKFLRILLKQNEKP